MKNRTPIPADQRPALPPFTPVPRKHRQDGWTADRQRAFIDALADTGSVKAAAQSVNMSSEGAYALRRQPGAESFRAAWEAALAVGVQTLTDVAIDRALSGVPVPVFYQGEQVGERRSFNDRLLMFILKHHIPGRYDALKRPGGGKDADTLAREATENCPVCQARAIGPTEGDEVEWVKFMAEMIKRYTAKIRSERHYRLSGQVIAADFALRQLTHIELILDVGGTSMATIKALTLTLNEYGEPDELYASKISEILDEERRAVWAERGEPARPPLSFPRILPTTAMSGGPTMRDRDRARRTAETTLVAAQAKWEATAREDSWAAWLAANASSNGPAMQDDAGDGRS
ncbi:MAG TPA: hypothetical protein VF695_08345 [Sphingomonas sp.]